MCQTGPPALALARNFVQISKLLGIWFCIDRFAAGGNHGNCLDAIVQAVQNWQFHCNATPFLGPSCHRAKHSFTCDTHYTGFRHG